MFSILSGYKEEMSEHKLGFDEVRPFLLHDFRSEASLLKSVEEVGKLFNFYRENIHSYRGDEKLVSAYCAYYLTTNYPKLFETLKLLGPGFEIGSFKTIIDVGTGPGTFLLALARLSSKETKLIGVDVAPLMLEQAQKLLKGLAGDRDFRLVNGVSKLEESVGSLLLFTHSLNEMGTQKAIEYVNKTTPEAILLIEPGTKESFQNALELRNWALENDYQVAYPCFSNASCPLDPEKDWCHQFIQVEQADDVERMTQKLHRNRRLLPMVAQLYVKGPVESGDCSARLIRVKKATKHSLEWELCESVEGANYVFNAEIPKRGMSKREVKALEDILAGVSVQYETEKEMKEKRRIQLLPKQDSGQF